MAGYIGARSVSLSTTVANAQDVTATDTTPEVTIINNTHEDTDGGREGKVIFKGQQSGGEESTLAEIEANHSGSSDDELGQLVFKTNDGSDGTSPTERLRINNTEVVFNDNSNDLDFRIESDDNANMFVVNAADDVVGIGRTPTSSEGSVLQLEGGDGLALRRPSQTNSFLLRPLSSSDGDGIRFTQGGTGDRMRIDSSGHVLIATTDSTPWSNNANSTADKGIALRAEGFIAAANYSSSPMDLNRTGSDGNLINFYKSGSNIGSISVTSSATAFNTSSDHRLKENVTDVTDGITRVKQLAPKRFNFIVNPDTTVDGFIAHEAATVVPEAVHGTKDEVDDNGDAVMQGIDQSKLVPLLTAALQEAIAKIETLETKVAALEAE